MPPHSFHRVLLAGASLAVLAGFAVVARADDTPQQMPAVTVEASAPPPADGSKDNGYRVTNADLGPLGNKPEQDTPFSITDIPAGLMDDHQDMNLSQIIKFDSSAQQEPRVDLDSGRPQTRGFENSNTQNTRIDGFNSYTIMAYPMEEYQDIQILNGAAGALYGPSAPAGTFNFVSKRPTETPFNQVTAGFDSDGLFTEHAETSGTLERFGYRLNAVHTDGESYVSTSRVTREVLSGDFDFHLTDTTKLELNTGYYQMHESGFPAALVYGNGTFAPNPASGTKVALANYLPSPLDPTKAGYAVQGAGEYMQDYDASAKIIQDLNDNWKLTVGAMYQDFIGTYGPAGTYGAADPGNWLMSNGKTATIVADNERQAEVESDQVYLNGHEETWGLTHDLVIGTNGYQQTMYARRGQNYLLGISPLLTPSLYSSPSFSDGNGLFKSGYNAQQSIILGDTIGFDEHWSVLASASGSWLRSISYGTTTTTKGSTVYVGPSGTKTTYNAFGVSPLIGLIYKPVERITTYVTYTDALQQGDTLTDSGGVGTTELPPYRSVQWEMGAKATVNDRVDLGVALFHITRPYAYDVGTSTGTVLNTSGEQINDGVEVTAKGRLTDQITIFGGVTYIDPRIEHTQDPTTTNKLVVSVPKWQGNLYVDYAVPAIPGLSLNGDVHYTGQRAANVTNTSWAASYTTLDIGLVYRTAVYGNPTTLRAGINNVTNVKYWAAILPETSSGSSSQAGNTGTVYEAIMGAPLTAFASATVGF